MGFDEKFWHLVKDRFVDSLAQRRGNVSHLYYDLAARTVKRIEHVQDGKMARFKSPLEKKAAKEAGEEYYDPKREDNIEGRNETRLALWEEHFKNPIGPLDKALKCVES